MVSIKRKILWALVFFNKFVFLDLDNVKIVSTEETLDSVISILNSKEKGAYLRFGDGEIYGLKGKSSRNHKSNPKLMLEIKASFTVKRQKYN